MTSRGKRSPSGCAGQWVLAVLLFTLAISYGQEPPPPGTRQKGQRKASGPQPVRTVGGVRAETDVAFLGPDRKEKMDIYIPADAKEGQRFPCIIDIHGGGFMSGDKTDAREQRICNTLAQRGYVAVSINYFLPEHDQLSGFPKNIHDCKTAVRFLRKNAAQYRIAPAQFAVIGGSAGGYFAAIMLVTKDSDALDPKSPYGDASCEIQAAVDMYGPVDLAADTSTVKGTVVEKFLTRVQSTWSRDKIELLSPATHVSASTPPILVTHGAKDASISISQSERFVALLKKAGATCYYFPLPDAGHSFDLQTSGVDLRDTVTAFLDKHLKGKDVKIPEPKLGVTPPSRSRTGQSKAQDKN